MPAESIKTGSAGGRAAPADDVLRPVIHHYVPVHLEEDVKLDVIGPAARQAMLQKKTLSEVCQLLLREVNEIHNLECTT